MAIPYICQSCRHQLLLRPRFRLHRGDWISRATLGTFSESVTKACWVLPAGISKLSSLADKLALPERPVSTVNLKKAAARAGPLEQLFADTTKRSRPPKSGTGEKRRSRQAVQVLERSNREGHGLHPQYHSYRRLQSMLSKQHSWPLSECWKYFEQHCIAHALPMGLAQSPMQKVQLSRLRSNALHVLLKRIVDAFAQEGQSKDIPSPANTVQLFIRLGCMQDSFWAIAIGPLLARAAEISPLGQAVTSDTNITPIASPDNTVLLDEALRLWRQFFTSAGLKHVPKSSKIGDVETLETSRDWFIPEIPPPLKPFKFEHHNFQTRFLHCFPGLSDQREDRTIPLAALMTFELLSPSKLGTHADEQVQRNSDPFVLFIAQLLPYAEVGAESARPYLISLGFPLDFIVSTLDGWQDLTSRALALLASSPSHKAVYQQWQDVKGGVSIAEQSVLRRLSQAVKKQDLTRTELLWKEAQGQSNTNYPRTDPAHDLHAISRHPPAISAKMYDRFLMSFMSLRHPDRAVDVWNEMVSNGLEPTHASWQAMLDGCRNAWDAKALEEVWSRMITSGIKPDIGCWTTRIHCLMGSKNIDGGMRALRQMAQTWQEAARQEKQKADKDPEAIEISALGDIGDVIKPTIATINAALSSLLFHKDVQVVQQVLSWAGEMGIKPDISTYNILLRRAIRLGEPEETAEILRQMEKSSIVPDVVTYTTILDGMFRGPHRNAKATPEQQKSAVMQVLDQMEKNGVQPNAHSYGTLIDGLLRSEPNPAAVRAVLDHMTSKGVKPSPHIYTMLLTHHFAQSPPDLAAVAALWKRMRVEGTTVDFVFYDRLIEGYARAGELQLMMSALDTMVDQGRAPGWYALTAILSAFTSARLWHEAVSFVHRARAPGGLLRNGVRGRRGEDGFWAKVDVLVGRGLVSLTDVPEAYNR